MSSDSSYKVVVVGNSGVGKTSLVNLISSNVEHLPSSTVGCMVSVVPHQFRAGSAEEKNEFIELWDIGGSAMHQKAAAVFLDGAAGAILVHDLSNMKSEDNLSQWISLLLDSSRSNSLPGMSHINLRQNVGIDDVPIPKLVVGCKLDLAPNRASMAKNNRIYVDCNREMVPGSTNRIILSKFFDAVILRSKNLLMNERSWRPL